MSYRLMHNELPIKPDHIWIQECPISTYYCYNDEEQLLHALRLKLEVLEGDNNIKVGKYLGFLMMVFFSVIGIWDMVGAIVHTMHQ